MTGHDERGALAVDAGLVEVAAPLVHRHLRAEIRLDVDERHAGGVLGTVTAPFTDPAVDPHGLRQRRPLPARAQPAFLCGTGVEMDEGGDAVDGGELALRPSRVVPVQHGGDRVEPGVGERTGLGRGDHDLLHAFEGQPVGELGDAHPPDRGLAPGHGYCVVVEDLVGHGDAGCHCGTHRQRSGVEERAVAQILRVVAVLGEGRHPYPLRPLAPHLRHADRVAAALLVERRHNVAADTQPDQLVLVGAGGDVVRAARAEVRGARGGRAAPEVDADRGTRVAPVHLSSSRCGKILVPPQTGQHVGHEAAGHRPVARDEGSAVTVLLPEDPGLVRLPVQRGS